MRGIKVRAWVKMGLGIGLIRPRITKRRHALLLWSRKIACSVKASTPIYPKMSST